MTSSLHWADPAGTFPTPWSAGFIGNGWITEDFTKSGFQQRQWTIVLYLQKVSPCLRRSGYAQAGPRLSPLFPPALSRRFFSNNGNDWQTLTGCVIEDAVRRKDPFCVVKPLYVGLALRKTLKHIFSSSLFIASGS